MHLPSFTMPCPLPSRRRGRAVLRTVLTAAVVTVAGPLALAPGAVAAPSTAGTTTAAAVSVPKTPTSLPAGLEGLASYVAANSCDPHAKPGATALGDLLKATYAGSSYGIDRTCGTDPLPTSEHYDGRAIDFFRNVKVPAQKAQINALIAWLFAKDSAGNPYANARRLGIMYLIWNNRIWGSYRAADGWRPYSSCATHTSSAYDTTCHRDHIHISLSWEGAMKRTSFWSGKVAVPDYGPCREAGLNWAAPYTSARTTPCPNLARPVAPAGASALLKTLTTYSGMVLRRGDSGPVVRAIQQTVGTTADGSFGPVTAAAVSSWQTAHGIPASGVVTATTWRAMINPVVVVTKPVSTPTHPELTRYKTQTLRLGVHGAAVKALQHRLSIARTSRFGKPTRTRVRTFQRRHNLSATGVVGPRTWRALGA
jgi:peptidoglycan hydrolase-like protein with peptidoglycan-binding domain